MAAAAFAAESRFECVYVCSRDDEVVIAAAVVVFAIGGGGWG